MSHTVLPLDHQLGRRRAHLDCRLADRVRDAPRWERFNGGFDMIESQCRPATVFGRVTPAAPRGRRRLAVAAGLALLAGCATAPPRRHPAFDARVAAGLRIGVVTPDVELTAISAGGRAELDGAWSEQGRKAVADAVAEQLRTRGFEVRMLEAPPGPEQPLGEARLLYRAVHASIHQATRANAFPAKVARFEYSLGSVADIADAAGVQTLAFVFARGAYPTAGRAVAMLLGAAAVAGLGAVGAVTGPMIIPVSRPVGNFVSVAIVDRSGDVLWFDVEPLHGYDLRNVDHAAEAVGSVMRDLPGGRTEGGWPQ